MNVTLTPRSADDAPLAACGAPCQAVVPARGTVILHSADEDILTNRFDGTALIVADRPVMVWLRTTSPDGHRDDTLMTAVPLIDGTEPVDLQGDPRPPVAFRPFYMRFGASVRPTPLPPSPTPPPATATLPATATSLATATLTATPTDGPAEPTEPQGGPTPSGSVTPSPVPMETAAPTAVPSATLPPSATTVPSIPTPVVTSLTTGGRLFLPWARTDFGPATP